MKKFRSRIILIAAITALPAAAADVLVAAPAAAPATVTTPVSPVPIMVNPRSIAVAKDGTLRIMDPSPGYIYKLDRQGKLTLLAKTANTGLPFNWPSDSIFDHDGNLLVPAFLEYAIYKIAPDGKVTTLAGQSGMKITVDGPLAVARFRGPIALAMDAAGNIFVADNYANCIRKIATDGTVSTYSGKSEEAGAVDGPAADARFGSPRALAIDHAGVLYVVDEKYNTIRRIAPDGFVSTLAGNPAAEAGSKDGKATAATFSAPRGIAIDAKDNVYVSDSGSNTIRKITPDGAVTTFAGKAGAVGLVDGKGADALFNVPRGLAFDHDGNLFVADADNKAIRKISPDGTVKTIYVENRSSPLTPPAAAVSKF